MLDDKYLIMGCFVKITFICFFVIPFTSFGEYKFLRSSVNDPTDTITVHNNKIECEYPVFVGETIGFKCGIDSFNIIIEGITGNYIETIYLLKSEKGEMEIIQIESEYNGLNSESKVINKSHSYYKEGKKLKECVGHFSDSDGSNVYYKCIKYYEPIPTGIWKHWDEYGNMTAEIKD